MRDGLPDVDVLAYNLRPNICIEQDLPSQNPSAFLNYDDFLFDRVRGTYGNQDSAFSEWQLLNDCSVKNSLDNLVDFSQSLGRALQRESDRELRKSCRHTLPLKPMMAHNVAVAEGQTSRLILSLFKRGAAAAIAYDHAALYSGTADRKESDHTSTIVGSRWNPTKGICEFKLRNSQGPYCKKYRKDWACIKGQLWVPSAALDQMSTSVFYIDPQK